MTAPLLEVEELSVELPGRIGSLEAIRGVNLVVQPGEVLGLVGESGCGKSLTMLAVMGLLPPGAKVRGAVRWQGRDLVGLHQRELAALRGAGLGMVFQDPMTALNPVHRIGAQIAETIRIHDRRIGAAELQARTLRLLYDVAIPFPERRLLQYPHELSGGMRQRVVIAMAMANNPALLIADEPTTALDVTIQAQILELLLGLQASRGMALVLISHDLGVVAGIADTVSIMYAGRIVETGPVDAVFDTPRHPYTQGLLASLPRLDRKVARLTAIDGTPPPLQARPSGCPFHPRCPRVIGHCALEEPALRPLADVAVACHRAGADG